MIIFYTQEGRRANSLVFTTTATRNTSQPRRVIPVEACRPGIQAGSNVVAVDGLGPQLAYLNP